MNTSQNLRFMAIALVMAILPNTLAQPALGLDPTFKPVLTVKAGSFTAAAMQPDGKIVLGGGFDFIHGVARRGIVRLNNEGSLDPTFNSQAGPSHPDPDSLSDARFLLERIRLLRVLSNGKIIVGGEFETWNGLPRRGVVRLNADGTVDAGFDPKIPGEFFPLAALEQSDGKLLIGGYNSGTQPKLVRFNSDNSLDGTFAPQFVGEIVTIAAQRDGKLLVGGAFNSVNGVSRSFLVRLNQEGGLDAAYAPVLTQRGFSQGRLYSIIVQPDGKAIINGNFTEVNGTSRPTLARLNPDGSLDEQFNPPVQPVRDFYRPTLQSDGRVLAQSWSGLERLNSNGTLDATFTTVAAAGGDFEPLELDGKVITTRDWELIRLNFDGALDSSFMPVAPQKPGAIYSVFSQSDGKVILPADLFVDGTARGPAVRLNPDGSVDTRFDPDPDSAIERILFLQPDGKVLVERRTINGPRIGRINADGNWDVAFEPKAIFFCGCGVKGMSGISGAATQQDGKVIVWGQFGVLDLLGAWIENTRDLVRFNADGSLDQQFNENLWLRGTFIQSVLFLAPTSDSKLLIAGNFTNINGVSARNLARLDADGGIDSTFVPAVDSTNLSIASLAVLIDGKIVVAGALFGSDAPGILSLARFNADGSLDRAFSVARIESPADLTETSVYNRVDIVVDTGGNVILAGNFHRVNGVARAGLARLYRDGNLDTQFNPNLTSQPGWDRSIWSLAMQNDGSLLIGGAFTAINGEQRVGLARFRPVPVLRHQSLVNGFSVSIGGEPNWTYRIETSTDLLDWMLLRELPSAGALTEFNDDGVTSKASKFYRVRLKD